MTTIAFRNGVMVADSLISSGGARMGTMAKAVRRDDGALCGACGSSSVIRSILDWFVDGEKEPRPSINDNEAQALIVRPSGAIEWHDDCGFHVLNAPFFAIGSGRDFALGAMAAHAGAEEAVEIASRLDTATGGPILVVRAQP